MSVLIHYKTAVKTVSKTTTGRRNSSQTEEGRMETREEKHLNVYYLMPNVQEGTTDSEYAFAL